MVWNWENAHHVDPFQPIDTLSLPWQFGSSSRVHKFVDFTNPYQSGRRRYVSIDWPLPSDNVPFCMNSASITPQCIQLNYDTRRFVVTLLLYNQWYCTGNSCSDIKCFFLLFANLGATNIRSVGPFSRLVLDVLRDVLLCGADCVIKFMKILDAGFRAGSRFVIIETWSLFQRQ